MCLMRLMCLVSLCKCAIKAAHNNDKKLHVFITNCNCENFIHGRSHIAIVASCHIPQPAPAAANPEQKKMDRNGTHGTGCDSVATNKLPHKNWAAFPVGRLDSFYCCFLLRAANEFISSFSTLLNFFFNLNCPTAGN